MGTYSQFSEKRCVLFSTDVASRGLDFNKAVDWVVQVGCHLQKYSYYVITNIRKRNLLSMVSVLKIFSPMCRWTAQTMLHLTYTELDELLVINLKGNHFYF